MRFIRRFKGHRHDKLRLWVGLFVTSAVPIIIFWVLPNAFAAQRERAAAARELAEREAAESFRIAYADLIAFCDEDAALNEMASAPSVLRLLIVMN